MTPKTKAKETLITRSIGRFYRSRKSAPSESEQLVWEKPEEQESPAAVSERIPEQNVVSIALNLSPVAKTPRVESKEECIELHSDAILPVVSETEETAFVDTECCDEEPHSSVALLASFDAMMTTDNIAERAFQIWVRNGKKHGNDSEQWEQARGELLSEFIASLR